MSEDNDKSKWMMWGLGIMLTIGIASQGAQIHYVNLKFADHEGRVHDGSVHKERFGDLYEEIKKLREQVRELQEQVARLDERLKR